MKKRLILFIVIFVLVCLAGIYFTFIFSQKIKDPDIPVGFLNEKQVVQNQLSPAEIMDIIKTDKDYNDLSKFVTGFNPEIIDYIKLSPNEYKKIRLEWQDQGFGDRIGIIDKISLTDFTYWIELRNKNDETKGLRIILDTKEKKSLLLIAALSVRAGVGL